MDVAKRLAQWRDQPPEQWFTATNRYLPPGRHGVGRDRHCLSAGHADVAVVPGSAPALAPPSRSVNAAMRRLQKICAIDRHRTCSAKPRSRPRRVAAAVVDAPDTTLSLRLTGILSREGDPNGSASSRQSRRGEDLFGRSEHRGRERHHAALGLCRSGPPERDGRLETLRLPKELSAVAGSPTAIRIAAAAAPLAERLAA